MCEFVTFQIISHFKLFIWYVMFVLHLISAQGSGWPGMIDGLNCPALGQGDLLAAADYNVFF